MKKISLVLLMVIFIVTGCSIPEVQKPDGDGNFYIQKVEDDPNN
ncbi:hypothetical protein [Bacillus shivajii]|nr:hypothetical protein [Bacillus shivajii]